MNAVNLFRILYAARVTVTPAPDGMVEATGPLTPSIRELIRTNKDTIRHALEEQGIGDRDDPPWTDPRRYVIPPSCIAPLACHRLGPCGPPATLTPCDRPVASTGESNPRF
jgi:hypothetical protein